MEKKSKIAIIGASGLFPKSADKKAFWSNLMNGKFLIDEATSEEFGADPQLFFDPKKGISDKCYSIKGGYIRDFYFDPEGYFLPASYLLDQDKSYQWSLFVAREALKDSGYLNKNAVLEKCGVILGNLSFPSSTSHQMMSSFYTKAIEKPIQELLNDASFHIKGHESKIQKNKLHAGVPSKMVSEALGLSGHHYTLDAACATSLYAIKLACDDLLSGKMDMMLAGAISASAQLFIHMGFSIFQALAPMDKKFAPLDKSSEGLASSEGAGMVALKRLVDAQRDGDKILGVIGGIGLSNDGRGKFLLSPHPKGQKLALERAYKNNDERPEQTTYLECHATGTPLGDTTEINTISDFFKPVGIRPMLGSVKSNMGHLLTAAGMPGLLKVLMSMERKCIPPSIHIENPIEATNAWIGADQMVRTPTIWDQQRKQAGINSFGFGGTNAHMIVKEYDENEKTVPFIKTPLVEMSIVGMDVHFGDCDNLDKFYNSVYHGRQHFKELPKTRWKGFEANEKLLKEFGFKNGRAPKGAYIDQFEIDLLRYRIQPNETYTLEPQQALILKVVDRAIKDAKLSEGSNVAVLIAMEPELANHNTLARWDIEWQLNKGLENYIESHGADLDHEEISIPLIQASRDTLKYRKGQPTASQHTSFVGNLMACRISALWDFTGPSFTISQGEQSTYKALEVAQNLLSSGEVDSVVVGAVDFAGGIENVMLRHQEHPIEASKKIGLSHDIQSNGWSIGEGAGAIVLKAVSNEKDLKSYAHIDELGSIQNLEDIGYLELAATGIQKEDIEERQNLFNLQTPQSIALGSVKANIGHTYAASGIAALIKSALCVYHRFIPGVPNWHSPKNESKFDSSKYYFPSKSRPWVLQNGIAKRKASIWSGEGNTINISEGTFQKQAHTSFIEHTVPSLFLIKGNSTKTLVHQLSALEIAAETNTSIHDIANLFYAKYLGKEGSFCISVVAKTKDVLISEISYFKDKISDSIQNNLNLKTPGGSFFTPNALGNEGKVAFVYPGSATAHPGLGQDLFQLFPELYEHYEKKNMHLDSWVQSDHLYPKTLTNKKTPFNIYNDAVAMMSAGVFYASCATFVLQDLFKVNTKIAFGYSMGETSSMWYAQNVWGTEGTKVFQSSPIFKSKFNGQLETLADYWNVTSEKAKERWTSLILLTSKEIVAPLVRTTTDVFLTFVNTAEEVIISGDKDQCQKIVDQIGCKSIAVPFQNIIHHPFCNRERQGLIDMHRFQINHRPDIQFYSSIKQGMIELDTDVLAKNSTEVCCRPVDFPVHVQNVYDAGARIFVEVGAGSTCSKWIKTILKDKPHQVTAISQKRKPEAQSLVELLAQLASHQVKMDLSILFRKKEKEISGKQFFKAIIPGGRRINDVFLTEENHSLAATFCHKINNKKRSNSKLLVAQEIATTNIIGEHKDTILNRLVSSDQNQIKNTTSSMEVISLSNKEQENKIHKTGENGLLLQDYSEEGYLKNKKIIFDQKDLETFSTGKIADVFGPEYAIIDQYRRRVMLPMHPYLLVSRVTEMDATLGSFQPSFMQTEYDIPYNAWYTTDRQIPTAVSVESGQCDLLLISYLGIDLQNKGDLVYRLLDCTLTFVDDLPFEGQTLRYDISINSFVKNADNLLFFFSYRCYVQDRLVLKMDGGCAGFFKDEQLSEGNGVVYTESELAIRKKTPKKHFAPLLHTHKTFFSKADLIHLINGNPHLCFDDIAYFPNGRNPSLCLPPEKILMIDRITSVDLKGGAYGLGYIIAEKDLHADDWYFPCHFRDDEVLAGSLQAEGGGNLLRFFMLMLGLQRLTKDARYQPIFDLPQKVRCRKQVTPNDTKLIYKLEIKEIGLIPNPYVIGDLEIISDGVITVHFENLGLQLREKTNPKYLEKNAGVEISSRSEGALLNELDIVTFALDDLSKSFGPKFAVYDGGKVSRQPNGDLQMISRIMKVDGKFQDFSKPSTIFAEYDVPENVWFYEENASYEMPYAVLMEIALQPCGLLGAYLGSTLLFEEKSLFIRNLDGEGTLLVHPNETDFRGKTIENKTTLVSSVAMGGTVLQNYEFALSVDGKVFYHGSSSFGFFSQKALAQQVGLDKGKNIAAWYETQGLGTKDYMQIKMDSLYGQMKLYKAPESQPHYRLAEKQLNLIDQLILAKNIGEYGKGYIHATKKIRPYDWYFTCHFYQDPVMPGSLGVEAILQAMQVFALQQDLGKDFISPRFVQLTNHKTIWKYRGQIRNEVENMHLEVHIKSIEKSAEMIKIVGDAYLWNEEMRIYQVTDLGLGIKETNAI